MTAVISKCPDCCVAHAGDSTAAAVPPLLVSVKEAARALSVSPWTLYQLLDAGKIESRYHGPFGRHRLVVMDSLRAYVDTMTRTPQADPEN